MSELTDAFNPRHPHEPEIPPALDPEGRCLVCGLILQRDAALERIPELERSRDEWKGLSQRWEGNAKAALERAERLKKALAELRGSLQETENGELFEDFTEERWFRFSAAYEEAGAALEGHDG